MKNKAIKIIKILQANGYKAVFAGGCVRDMLLHKESHDIDIATSASPDEVEKLFEKTIPVGKSFGVIRVVLEDKIFEVATFRNDGKYSDSRRPESVTFSNIKEDAKRRDLTINGLFYDPIKDEIIDYVNGQEDIKRGIIRFIGDPVERIEEDKLRMLRALRFSMKFNFRIERESFNAIKQFRSEITKISMERIQDELVKMILIGNRD